jgi:hypothetical protein
MTASQANHASLRIGDSIMRRRIWTCIIVATVASAGLAQTASAQRSEEPSVGSRVRIGLPDSVRAYPFVRPGQWVTGTLARTTQDSLVINVGGANPLYVARGNITGLEVSQGSSRMRSAVDHALFGGVLFAVATYLVDNSEGGLHAQNVAKAAGSGVAVGAVAGALSPFEHWRKVRR